MVLLSSFITSSSWSSRHHQKILRVLRPSLIVETKDYTHVFPLIAALQIFQTEEDKRMTAEEIVEFCLTFESRQDSLE